MEAKQLVDILLEHTVTRGELLRRIGTIRDFLEQQFFKPNPKTLTEFLSGRTVDGDPDVIMRAGDDFFRSFTRENVYQMCDAMHAIVASLPSIVLYVPYVLDDAESTKLGSWFRQNVHGHVLLDVKTDAAVLGGCALVNDGMWRDYSLKYFMQKKRGEIVEKIGEYVGNS